MHFVKWDETKYERLGDFLLNNHTTAWRIVQESLEILETTRQMDPNFEPDVQCPQWLDEEHNYISSLQFEPQDEKAKVVYLEATEHLERAEETVRYWIAQIAVQARLPPQHADRHLREANEAVESTRAALATLGLALPAMSRTRPWVPGSPERLEAIALRQQRDYNHLLDDLEHRAISHIVILRGRDDVREKPWAKPLLRKATRAWHKLQRAREEIDTVRLEAHQVWTSMENEEAWLRGAIENTRSTNPALARYISATSQYRLNVNAHLRSKLAQLDKLAHFLTGDGEGTTSGPPASPDTCGSPENTNSNPPNIPPNETPSTTLPSSTTNLIPSDDIDGGMADGGLETENEEVEESHRLIGRIASALESLDLNFV
ncbi:uncharacterized protein EI90DRAFT_3122689 [Cantharellus anzutake]|uniref:uncharacterized protein n=1 Tax=Cantharellus anzutake TaxID=1750568 RepID=UPI0019042D8C|nr:uncharacterized protein EI90DRAFT_3122689 [Cantharellus anzutake]KAF8332248.1 hypothetical protein EI90DRAFT_3122689 [Cantharellus anzutake]